MKRRTYHHYLLPVSSVLFLSAYNVNFTSALLISLAVFAFSLFSSSDGRQPALLPDSSFFTKIIESWKFDEVTGSLARY